MTSRKRRGLHLVLIIMLTLPIAGLAGLTILHARGERLLSVQTASMVPTFRPGDAVIVKPVPLSSLQKGDVISYRSPRNQRVIITHRLIGINRRAGQLVTAGDKLHSPDQPFAPRLVIGRATAVLPGLGSVLDAMRHPLGLLFLVYLPAALVVGAEAMRVKPSLSRRPIC